MLIIGHRGAKGLAPENTLASLQAAIDAKVDMIEFDVRVTADNVPVLHHDPVIKTDSGQKLAIRKTSFSDLQLAKKDLLTLEAALQFIDRQTGVLLDIKPGQPAAPIAACIQPRLSARRANSELVLSSLDYKLLKKLRAEFPEIPVAVIEPWSGVKASWHARRLETDLITMNQLWLWSGFIKSMSRRGYKLSAYSIENPSKARKWEQHGLYGCITGHPDRFSNTEK